MRKCIFSGPTLSGEDVKGEIKFYQPAMLGSVFRAVEAGYRQIGIVDGYFGNTPAVWHKEILYAIACGVQVVGAGSIGALRAAELYPFGMQGVGTVFRLYKRGVLQDDDEVCVLHGPRELGYLPLSEPMINIRYTLRKLRKLVFIDKPLENQLVLAMKSEHFTRRTRKFLEEAANANTDGRTALLLSKAFGDYYVDVKRQDALRLISVLKETPISVRVPMNWEFPKTTNWIRQFEQDLEEVPILE